MWGTVVNALAILAGSLVGLMLRRGLPESVKETVLQGIALGVLVIGFQMALATRNVLVVLVSLVIGGIAGELFGIEKRLEWMGKRLEAMAGAGGNGGQIARGFVTATLIYCVGAMAIMGALQSGLDGQYSILYAKSLLDGVSSVMLTSTMGAGVALSAIPVFLYQGVITLAAGWLEGYLTEPVIAEMKATGGVLIIGIGITLLGLKQVRIGNLLPAVVVAVLLTVTLAAAGIAW